MPRFTRFPTTCEECNALSVKDLQTLGFLQPGVHDTTLTWPRKGPNSPRIGLTANLVPDTEPYLHVVYVHEGVEHDYRIALEVLPSNLPALADRPGRYRLRCPVSGRPASVLYLHRGLFVHRLAFAEDPLYYAAQLTPKWLRRFDTARTLEHQFLAAREAFHEPGRKTHYRGKPTRWYARFLALRDKMTHQA